MAEKVTVIDRRTMVPSDRVGEWVTTLGGQWPNSGARIGLGGLTVATD